MSAPAPPRLTCRWRRLWPGTVAVVGLAFAAVAADALVFHAGIEARGAAARLLLGGLGVFGLGLAVAMAPMLWRPPILLVVDRDGLAVPYRVPGTPGRREVFRVPWARVRGVEWLDGSVARAGRTRLVRAIALPLAVDEGFRIPAGVSQVTLHDDPGDVLHLDASSPTPGGRRLFELLRAMHASHGPGAARA